MVEEERRKGRERKDRGGKERRKRKERWAGEERRKRQEGWKNRYMFWSPYAECRGGLTVPDMA